MNLKDVILFEIVSSFKNKNINLPKRQTSFSAGYDFESAIDFKISPKTIFLTPTGIKSCFNKDKVLMIYARSSLSLKKSLMLANNVGIIDSDYYNNLENEGHIFIPLYNFSDKEIFVFKGERIAQGIFQKFYLTNDDNLKNMSRNQKNKVRKSGFGSTDVDHQKRDQ
ncbi:MAG: deoxyuridine 5'-triphosphate nucleotidohydrolase [Candidatus Phytoplasma cynodontis]|uniref:dUTP diphosphatase n=1 Tax='Cynodon dactylon' phytoplasma TaxID=295320 RepID=UPI001265C863|nr:dUTP diphosphatase ['Cynodon dactylon' phytoplasma]KAB8122115.1 dUTP diphosphatase ['Cynodon dactylon' phytoplasma]WIA07875.1 MAG: deoxyuridine 5'-triphosphate nucleotidohydrolase [Candidatus Phytoplasma cynodontis]